MTIKSILVPVVGQRQGPSAIEAAFFLARQFDAHVEGLHILPDPGAAVPYVSEGMSGDMIQQICDATEKEGQARSKRAKALFSEICRAHGISMDVKPGTETGVTASWKVLQGQEDLVTAAQSRNADITVVNPPGGNLGPEYLTVLEGVLFQSGRPSLIVPRSRSSDFGTTVAIAWNGSTQASRAVASAMPILAQAKKIVVMQAGEPRENIPSAADVVSYLAWHGLMAATLALTIEREKIAESLLRSAVDTGADLVVMGAFTHSRWREMVLGGVTRYMLDNASIPILMSH
jgi:nucleotide-binding universal stress UspA family protein